MGANAQTTVPTFTTGQVLTADQQNQSARTGVPVFASTTTRDAAFGGTGEKTLAEGQLCYVENLTGVAQIQYYDGSSWVSLSGGGLVRLTGETAFTTASSITVDDVFSSTYTNYRIMFRYITSTTGDVSLKLRAAGTSASTNYNDQYVNGNSTTVTALRATGATSLKCAFATNGTFYSSISIDVFGPNLAEPTTFQNQYALSFGAYTSLNVGVWAGVHTTATAYDGIEFLTASGTMTGTYTIYGYLKS